VTEKISDRKIVYASVILTPHSRSLPPSENQMDKQ
jgi:hypothetical protein